MAEKYKTQPITISGSAKFEEMTDAARKMIADNRRTSGTALARKFGVDHKTIYAILLGRSWKHLTEKSA